MSYVFILLLKKNKYFVSMCHDPNKDINKYFEGYGPKWIIKYKPIKIVEIIHPCDIFDIDKHTKRYMAKYGISNVRGGTYTDLYLTKNDRYQIDKEIFSALGMCMHCGSEYHRSIECELNTFSGQVKYVLSSIKQQLSSCKGKLGKNLEPYISKIKTKKNIYNHKYNTMTNQTEITPIMYLESPRNIREIYEDEDESSSLEEYITNNLAYPIIYRKNDFSNLNIDKDTTSISLSNTPSPILSPKIDNLTTLPRQSLESPANSPELLSPPLSKSPSYSPIREPLGGVIIQTL